jgi:hypothetical protein
MNSEELWLALAPFAREQDFDVEALVRQLPEPRVCELATALAGAIVQGQATRLLWRLELPRDFTVALGTLWDRLVELRFAGPCEGTASACSTDALRLWAYTDEWLLLSQDQDLMIMLATWRDSACWIFLGRELSPFRDLKMTGCAQRLIRGRS